MFKINTKKLTAFSKKELTRWVKGDNICKLSRGRGEIEGEREAGRRSESPERAEAEAMAVDLEN
jgi:hypothetical protein